MYNILKNLINVKFYKTKEIAVNKVNVCFGMDTIKEPEYTELTMLIETKYTETVTA